VSCLATRFLACDRLSKLPVSRLSNPTTSKPRSTSRSVSWLPMKPAAPVTRIRLGMAHSESCATAEAQGINIRTWTYTPGNRMAKTIAISDEVYELLKNSRLPGESFSVTIRRNLKKSRLADIIGSGTISLDDWREVRRSLDFSERSSVERDITPRFRR
jgi:predicted CopG family antitoxin